MDRNDEGAVAEMKKGSPTNAPKDARQPFAEDALETGGGQVGMQADRQACIAAAKWSLLFSFPGGILLST
jgi:hypothetical protein